MIGISRVTDKFSPLGKMLLQHGYNVRPAMRQLRRRISKTRRDVSFMSENQWQAFRYPSTSIEELRHETVTWLAQLPCNVQPNALVQHFPRIANRIAALWETPLRCEKYLDELLFDTRNGKRQGFALKIAFEISNVKALMSESMECRRQALKPNHVNVWNHVS
jgi:hypothetical protein